MANPYQLPSLSGPVLDAGGLFTQPWSKCMREIIIALTAERAPKRYDFFGLSAADLADPAKFVQAGATAGLGTGDYLGWCLANGNNGSDNYDGYFIYGSTAAAGTVVGNNSNDHTHTVDPASFNSGSTPADLKAHTHGLDGLWTTDITGAARYMYAGTGSYATGAQTASAGTGGGHTHTVDVPSTTSSGASVTDNRPLSKPLVPVMRV